MSQSRLIYLYICLSPFAISSYLEEARAHRDSGDYSKAIEILKDKDSREARLEYLASYILSNPPKEDLFLGKTISTFLSPKNRYSNDYLSLILGKIYGLTPKEKRSAYVSLGEVFKDAGFLGYSKYFFFLSQEQSKLEDIAELSLKEGKSLLSLQILNDLTSARALEIKFQAHKDLNNIKPSISLAKMILHKDSTLKEDAILYLVEHDNKKYWIKQLIKMDLKSKREALSLVSKDDVSNRELLLSNMDRDLDEEEEYIGILLKSKRYAEALSLKYLETDRAIEVLFKNKDYDSLLKLENKTNKDRYLKALAYLKLSMAEESKENLVEYLKLENNRKAYDMLLSLLLFLDDYSDIVFDARPSAFNIDTYQQIYDLLIANNKIDEVKVISDELASDGQGILEFVISNIINLSNLIDVDKYIRQLENQEKKDFFNSILLYKNGYRKRALDILRNLNINRDVYLYFLAKDYFDKREYARALTTVKAFYREGFDSYVNSDVFYLGAISAIKIGDDKLAKSLYNLIEDNNLKEKVLLLDEAKKLYSKAILEESNGNSEKAIAIFERYLSKYPANEDIYFRLARLYLSSEEFEKAADFFGKLNSYKDIALNFLEEFLIKKYSGYFLDKKRVKTDEAIYITDILSLMKDDKESVVKKGEILIEIGLLDFAEKLFLSLNKSGYLSRIANLRGDHKKALSFYRAEDINKLPIDEKINVADAYIGLGLYEKAQNVLNDINDFNNERFFEALILLSEKTNDIDKKNRLISLYKEKFNK